LHNIPCFSINCKNSIGFLKCNAGFKSCLPNKSERGRLRGPTLIFSFFSFIPPHVRDQKNVALTLEGTYNEKQKRSQSQKSAFLYGEKAGMEKLLCSPYHAIYVQRQSMS